MITFLKYTRAKNADTADTATAIRKDNTVPKVNDPKAMPLTRKYKQQMTCMQRVVI
jgi:hypothetical protein